MSFTIKLKIDKKMYIPKEDSFFLVETLKDYFGNLNKKEKLENNLLDLGTGTGIISKTAIESGIKKENITASDIDEEAVKAARKLGVKAVKSDLFENKKLEKFDLIIFNPPYLPEDKYDREKDTTGGRLGDKTILRFLKQVRKHLNKNGEIFLLLSSLTPRARINKEIKNQKLIARKIAEKKLFFETLEIFLISNGLENLR